MWARADIEFDDIDYDATDHPVVTIRLATPVGPVELMAEVAAVAGSLRLRRLHIQSNVAPNAIGRANWRLVATMVMERMEYDEIIVEGAVRTTGASPGRRPHPIRFTRRVRAAPGSG
jgi:hypothetical protein